MDKKVISLNVSMICLKSTHFNLYYLINIIFSIPLPLIPMMSPFIRKVWSGKVSLSTVIIGEVNRPHAKNSKAVIQIENHDGLYICIFKLPIAGK